MSGTNKESAADEKSRGAGRRWPLFVGLPLIVLVALGAVLFSGGREEPSGTSELQSGSDAGEQEASGGGSALGTPALGSADAPVVMTEYGDFQ